MLQMASVVLLLAIAIDRCLRVRIPLTYKSTVTQKRSWILVALCWFTAALWAFIPMFGWHNYNAVDGTTNGNSTSFECSFLTVVSTSYLVNFVFFSSLLPPLAIMTGLYCYIFLTTRRQLRANIGAAAESSTYYQKEHRLAASLVLVLVLFAVCWLPLFLMHSVRYYGYNIEVPSFAIDIGVLLSHANSAVNPIVYAFRIPKIKEEFKKLWRDHNDLKQNPNLIVLTMRLQWQLRLADNARPWHEAVPERLADEGHGGRPNNPRPCKGEGVEQLPCRFA
ncbi:hypothetical protein AOLI_G00012090 [Acnodon oligacanthus]